MGFAHYSKGTPQGDLEDYYCDIGHREAVVDLIALIPLEVVERHAAYLKLERRLNEVLDLDTFEKVSAELYNMRGL